MPIISILKVIRDGQTVAQDLKSLWDNICNVCGTHIIHIYLKCVVDSLPFDIEGVTVKIFL